MSSRLSASVGDGPERPTRTHIAPRDRTRMQPCLPLPLMPCPLARAGRLQAPAPEPVKAEPPIPGVSGASSSSGGAPGGSRFSYDVLTAVGAAGLG